MKKLYCAFVLLLALTAPALAQTNPGTSPLSIAKGGTAASTAAGARANLGAAPAPSGSITLNVDHVAGVDSNTCGLAVSGTGACATIYHAYQLFQTIQKVGPGGTATIQSDCGFTETPPGAFLGPTATGNGVVFIIGNQASPTSCSWTSAGLSIDDGAVISLRGFKTLAAGSNQVWLSVTKMGLLVFANMAFSSQPSGAHMSLTDGGVLVYDGGTYQVGDAGCAPNCMTNHIVNNGGTFEMGSATISVPNALTFSSWYFGGGSGSSTNLGAGNIFSGAGAGAGSTGQQYVLTKNATIPNYSSVSTTFPGATAGSVFFGACVDNTCAPVAVSNVSGLGSNVGTALAVNVGTAGSFVVNGGTFTTLSGSTSLTSPIVYGGAAAGSPLTLQSTSSGSPSGDSILFKTGGVQRGAVASAGDVTIGGTSTCVTALLVLNGTNTCPTPVAGTQFQMVNVPGNAATLELEAYGNIPEFWGRAANGTVASPTATASGNFTFFLVSQGYDGNPNWGSGLGVAGFQASENFSVGHNGQKFIINTVPNGTTANVNALTVQASGGVSIGTAPDPGVNNIAAANFLATGAMIAKGSSPVGTTGSCTASSFVGGATAGKFSAALCAAGTIILSSLPTAPNGYTCGAQDQTTPADTLKQIANTVTSVTFQATTAASDAVVFQCTGW